MYQLTMTSLDGPYFGNILPSAVNFIIFIIVKLVPFRVPDTGSSNAFRSFGAANYYSFLPYPIVKGEYNLLIHDD